MATTAFEHTKEALAFITLYKSMPAKVKDMIINENQDQEKEKFTSLSLQSWDSDNDELEEESNFWDKFYQERKNV